MVERECSADRWAMSGARQSRGQRWQTGPLR
jgi:hypothetical protein